MLWGRNTNFFPFFCFDGETKKMQKSPVVGFVNQETVEAKQVRRLGVWRPSTSADFVMDTGLCLVLLEETLLI